MEELPRILLKLLGVAALVLLNGFFVAAEFALVKMRHTQLDLLIAKGHRRARIARGLLRHLDTTIGATQLGITLASLGLGVLVEPVFAGLLSPFFSWLDVRSDAARHTASILVGFLTNTFLLVVVGELGPKALAIRKTLAVALWTAPPLEWFYRVSYPFIWLLNHAAQWLLSQLGIAAASEAELTHSEEELRLLLANTPTRAGGTVLGRDIVLNALDLRRRIVRDVMRPRHEMVVLDTGASLAECLDIAERTRFSRFPLCAEGDPDKTIGVVHLKDLFAMRFRAKHGADFIPVARKIIYVPETARLEKLLQLFLERKLHFAIVVDEYGGTVGMATLENILEELVGQIQDEFDQEKPLLVQTGERTWDVLGSLPLRDLGDLVGEALQEEGITTTSGWITHRLGGFAKVGDALTLNGTELRVEEMEGMRVARVRLTRPANREATA